MISNQSYVLKTDVFCLENIVVFVVEPDQAVAEVLAFMLGAEGAEVHIAHRLSTAINALAQSSPDLLICNLKLPDGDGYFLLEHCKQMKHFIDRPIPAIAIAYSPWKLDRQKALTAGFDHYLFEPTEYSTLMAAIATVLHKKEY